MARIARVVIPNYPHHVIHRGNRRERVFFKDEDKKEYLRYLQKYATSSGIDFWGYCLMDNHVHFIAVPGKKDSLAKGFCETHKHYTRMINFRQGWRGHLWEGRFKSCVLSESHLYAALRYIEQNPVRAGMVKRAEDYPWSSARAHIRKSKDSLLTDNFMIKEIPDWADYLSSDRDEEHSNSLMKQTEIGRPLGDDNFLKEIESLAGKLLRKKKPGPKRAIK